MYYQNSIQIFNFTGLIYVTGSISIVLSTLCTVELLLPSTSRNIQLHLAHEIAAGHITMGESSYSVLTNMGVLLLALEFCWTKQY